MTPLQEKKEDRLLVLRESELREFVGNASVATMTALVEKYHFSVDSEGAAAIGTALLDLDRQHKDWFDAHSGHSELGRPPIPRVIVDALAAQMFDLTMRQRWNQITSSEGEPPTWEDEVDGPNADQKDEWRSTARGHLMNIWDDLVTYFSTQGVLWWTRLSAEDCQQILTFIEENGEQPEIEPILPLLREAATRGAKG